MALSPSVPLVTLEPATAIRNARMMRLLERVAAAFNDAAIPLMALKGAALHLLLYERPAQRPMDDLDLMVRPQDAASACAVLEGIGGKKGRNAVRADAFPRFHYETEYSFAAGDPIKVDLHARPFRPLRYAATIPVGAFWEGARRVAMGQTKVLVPCKEDMLIHLAVHAAVHGRPRQKWLHDIKWWLSLRGEEIDWEQVLHKATAWGLGLALQTGLEMTGPECESLIPGETRNRLYAVRSRWRERLSLWQAPRDADHPAAHVAVNALCTPGWRFPAAYLWNVLAGRVLETQRGLPAGA